MAAKLQRASDRLLEEFTELQMSDIAQVAGLARSSLYYYFANKDDVLAYLLRVVLADLNATSSAAASGPGTPSERSAAVIRAQLEHLDRYSSSAQYLFANLGRAGELAEIAARVTDGYYVPVKKLLVEGAADGTFRALPDVDLGASTLVGAVLASQAAAAMETTNKGRSGAVPSRSTSWGRSVEPSPRPRFARPTSEASRAMRTARFDQW